MKKLIYYLLLLLFLPQLALADLPCYNLKNINKHIFLGKFNSQKMYLGTIGTRGYQSALVVRTDTTRVDFEFCITMHNKIVSPSDSYTEVQDPTLVQVAYSTYIPEMGIPGLSQITNIKGGFKAVFAENLSRFMEPNIATHEWQWNKNQFDLTSTKLISPYQEELKMYRRLLKEGNLYEAIAMAPTSDPTGQGSPCYPIYEETIHAAYPIIIKEYKEGNKFAAASMALLLLEKEGLLGSCQPKNRFFTLKSRHTSQSQDGTYYNFAPIITLSCSEKSVAIVNDFAFIIREFNPSLAASLLKQVIQFYPERTVAYLNLADVIYSTNYKTMNDEIEKNYHSYIRQMTQNGLEKKIPEYARERIKTYEIKK